MNSHSNNRPSTRKRIAVIFLKTVLWIAAVPVLLVLTVMLLLLIPGVQKFATSQATGFLSGKLNTRVELGKLSLGLPLTVSLSDLYLEDERQDTLLYARRIEAGISLADLAGRKITLQTILLEGITGHIYREIPGDHFNFSFIPRAFSSEKESVPEPETSNSSAAWQFGIGEISLKDIFFTYRDKVSGVDARLQLGAFHTGFERFDLNAKAIHIREVSLEKTKVLVITDTPLPGPPEEKQESGPPGYDIALKRIQLSEISAGYQDLAGGQDLQVTLGNFITEARQIDLNNQLIDLDKVLLHQTNLSFRQTKASSQTDSAAVPDPETEKGSQSGPGWILKLGKLDLEKNKLSYQAPGPPATAGALNFNDLELRDFKIKASALYLSAKKINLDLDTIHFSEKSGFVLNKLGGRISYDTTQARIRNLDLQFNNSRLNDELGISYPSLAALKDPVRNLGIQASFKNTSILVKDLLYFSPDLLKSLPLKAGNEQTQISLSGRIGGSINHPEFSDLLISTKDQTSIRLNGHIRGLSEPRNMYASLLLEAGSSRKDLESLLADSLLPENLSLPETLFVRTSYTGYLKNFNTDILIHTSYGDITSKVIMSPDTSQAVQPYKGQITVDNFDLGKLLNQPNTLGPVSLSLAVEGKGLDTSNMDAQLSGEVIKARFKGYDYKQLQVNGQLKKQSFTGHLQMNDENLVFDFDGRVNLDPSHPEYAFRLDLQGADLGRLKLTEEDLRVSLLMQSDIETLPGKNPTGKASIHNLLVVRNNRKYAIDSISLSSELRDDLSDIQLRSDIMAADIKGQIQLDQLGASFNRYLSTYFNTQAAPPDTGLSAQKFDFSFRLLNTGLIASDLVPELQKLTPLSLNGSYDSQASILNVNAEIAQVQYNDLLVDSLLLRISSDPGQLKYTLNIAEISNPSLKFENTTLSGDIRDDKLRFSFQTAKDDSTRLLSVSGVLKSLLDAFELQLNEELIVNAERWRISPDNLLHFGKDGFFARQLEISGDNQSISVNSPEPDPRSPLEITFRDFETGTFSRLIENNKELVRGRINGQVRLAQKEKTPLFQADLELSNTSFQAVPIGTIRLKADNLRQPDIYRADLSIEGQGNELSLGGTYQNGPSGGLDFMLDIARLDLSSLEPFTAGQVSRMSGDLRGKLKLKGPASLPQVSGELRFREAALKPGVMDSYLSIPNSAITFEPGKIILRDFVIQDSLAHQAKINGSIDISNLSKIGLDLHLRTDEFLALNTTRQDNPLYYGKIIIDSDIRVKGTSEAPNVEVKAKLNKGSTLTYVKPESQVGLKESADIVEFVPPPAKGSQIMTRQNDTTANDLGIMKGVSLNASINVDKSVELKMIIDPTTGDSVFVQGGGLLDFGMDRSGQTNLSGKYSVSDGGYFLSLENLVKRSFKIQPGSSITWSGDILDAYLDMTAIYTVKTSPIDLIQNELAGMSELEKNKYRNLLTFNVYLKMAGFLSSPEISFDIDLAQNDRGALNGSINSRLAQLREDESQLNKQVFALLTLRRFIGENPLESGSEGGLASASRASASQVLTQQLNALSDRYVNFVDLDLGVNSFEDYSSGQQQGRTQLQLGVSKQLFNDKVTVRVGGNVDLEGERASQNSVNDVAGNISIDYKLTEDGRYKLKAARQNQYENPIEGELTKTSAGVVYVRNFNAFRQLFFRPESGKSAPQKNKKTDDKNQ